MRVNGQDYSKIKRSVDEINQKMIEVTRNRCEKYYKENRIVGIGKNEKGTKNFEEFLKKRNDINRYEETLKKTKSSLSDQELKEKREGIQQVQHLITKVVQTQHF